MKMRRRTRACMSLLVISVALGCGGAETTAPPLPDAVEALRESLGPYSSLARAKSAGYSTALTDCMSNGDLGAMGVHFGNVALIDDVVDQAHPEVLIYEPGASGEMSLVGVEFIIPFAIRPKAGPAPTLFGQKFLADDAFGLWGLHVWTHRANPSGLFAPWNPRVHC